MRQQHLKKWRWLYALCLFLGAAIPLQAYDMSAGDISSSFDKSTGAFVITIPVYDDDGKDEGLRYSGNSKIRIKVGNGSYKTIVHLYSFPGYGDPQGDASWYWVKAWRSSEANDYIDQVMDNCGLQPFHKDRYPHEFSGGQRQRICIARALALNPEFVVCDEPVSALDVSIQAQIINLLKELQEKYNLTYLFISHDLSVVEYISDTVGVMYLGNLVEYGTTEDIFRNPLHPYTEALFSAIPIPDPEAKMNRIVLEGSIPSPANPPEGCKFHTRCAHCMERCKHEAPVQKEVEPGHYVVCHLYDK